MLLVSLRLSSDEQFFASNIGIKRQKDIAINRKKDIFRAIFFFSMWIENIVWGIIKYKCLCFEMQQQYFDKKILLYCLSFYRNIALLQYCFQKLLVWRGPYSAITNGYFKFEIFFFLILRFNLEILGHLEFYYTEFWGFSRCLNKLIHIIFTLGLRTRMKLQELVVRLNQLLPQQTLHSAQGEELVSTPWLCR